MPLIQVMMYPRTHEKKAKLVKALTDATAQALEVPPEWVQVMIHDISKENWAQAGVLASDRKN